MPIWTKTDSLLEGIASVQRDKLAAERAIDLRAVTKSLKIKFKGYGRPNYNLKRALQSVLSHSHIDLTPPELANLILTANNNAFKLPMEANNYYYSMKYYNSTEHTLDISNMGIIDSNGQAITKVAPGGLISIPHPYTIGGRLSVVSTNAPQLRPIPTKLAAKDRILDLQPCSYVEWIIYHEYNNSPCCSRYTLWSDKFQKPVCSRCGKQVLV